MQTSYKFNIDNLGQDIVVQDNCTEIILRENDLTVTGLQNYEVQYPLPSSAWIFCEAGQDHHIPGPNFQKGTIIGKIRLVNPAVVSFQQRES